MTHTAPRRRPALRSCLCAFALATTAACTSESPDNTERGDAEVDTTFDASTEDLSDSSNPDDESASDSDSDEAPDEELDVDTTNEIDSDDLDVADTEADDTEGDTDLDTADSSDTTPPVDPLLGCSTPLPPTDPALLPATCLTVMEAQALGRRAHGACCFAGGEGFSGERGVEIWVEAGLRCACDGGSATWQCVESNCCSGDERPPVVPRPRERCYSQLDLASIEAPDGATCCPSQHGTTVALTGCRECTCAADSGTWQCDDRACAEGTYLCDSGEEIPYAQFCDVLSLDLGVDDDCADRSDEGARCLACFTNDVFGVNYDTAPPEAGGCDAGAAYGFCGLPCPVLCDDGEVLPGSFRCDGRIDCLDQADEAGCWTMCPDGRAIHDQWRCDGIADCCDGRDEVGCTRTVCELCDERPLGASVYCPTSVLYKECDGVYTDCPGLTDPDRGEASSFTCGNDLETAACADVCSGTAECSNGADEFECGLRCEDGSRVHQLNLCDGVNDCAAGSDEMGCD